MPELDELLDALIDDTRKGTRAPGAARAIARGRRRSVAAAGLAAAAISAAGGLAVSTLGGGDERSSLAASPSPSPPPSVFQEDGQIEGSAFRNQLRQALAGAAGWSVSPESDPTVLHPCAGEWSIGSTGGSGGTISISGVTPGPRVWSDGIGFASEAQASQAVTRLVRNLEACTSGAWTAVPIGRTGAVLATSDDAVVWIHRRGSRVSTLQVPTPDGAPPVSVQLEVAQLIDRWLGAPT